MTFNESENIHMNSVFENFYSVDSMKLSCLLFNFIVTPTLIVAQFGFIW